MEEVQQIVWVELSLNIKKAHDLIYFLTNLAYQMFDCKEANKKSRLNRVFNKKTVDWDHDIRNPTGSFGGKLCKILGNVSANFTVAHVRPFDETNKIKYNHNDKHLEFRFLSIVTDFAEASLIVFIQSELEYQRKFYQFQVLARSVNEDFDLSKKNQRFLWKLLLSSVLIATMMESIQPVLLLESEFERRELLRLVSLLAFARNQISDASDETGDNVVLTLLQMWHCLKPSWMKIAVALGENCFWMLEKLNISYVGSFDSSNIILQFFFRYLKAGVEKRIWKITEFLKKNHGALTSKKL